MIAGSLIWSPKSAYPGNLGFQCYLQKSTVCKKLQSTWFKLLIFAIMNASILYLTSKWPSPLCMNPTFQCCSNFALNFFILCHEIVLRLNLWWAWRLFRRMGISTFADGGRPPDRSRAIVSLWVIDTISKWLRPIYVSTDQCWQTCSTCVHCSYHCIVWCDVFNPSQRWWSLTT